MRSTVSNIWRGAFLETLRQITLAEPLKSASLTGALTDWTTHSTRAVIETCQSLGWSAAGIGHRLDILPQAGEEYLSLDVTAFEAPPSESLNEKCWKFPIAAFELENSPSDDRVAYSLWKLLCVRVKLRAVFCYRQTWERARATVSCLAKSVIGEMAIEERTRICGETVVATGVRGEGETFPYGYFKFWLLNTNTGKFEKI